MRGLKTRRLARLCSGLARPRATTEPPPHGQGLVDNGPGTASPPSGHTLDHDPLMMRRCCSLHSLYYAKLICAKRACIFLRFAAFAECAIARRSATLTASTRPPPGTPAYGGFGTPVFGRGVGTSGGTPLAPAPKKGAETGDKTTVFRGCSGVKWWRFDGRGAIKCGSGRKNGCQGGREGVR